MGKTASCLFFQLKWKSSAAALGICAKIPDRGEDELSLHGVAQVPLAETGVMICPNNAKTNIESHQSAMHPDLQDMSS